MRPLAWLFTAGGFAIQSLTTAKVNSRADEIPMVRFGVFVGATLSLLMGLCAFVEPVRSWILVDLMGERPGGRVLEFAVPSLMLAVGLPLFQSVRFALRGVLIARHHTRAITVINLVSLAMIGTAISFELLPTANGSFNAYVIWFSTMAVELVVMFRLIRAPHPVLADVTPPDRPPDW